MAIGESRSEGLYAPDITYKPGYVVRIESSSSTKKNASGYGLSETSGLGYRRKVHRLSYRQWTESDHFFAVSNIGMAGVCRKKYVIILAYYQVSVYPTKIWYIVRNLVEYLYYG